MANNLFIVFMLVVFLFPQGLTPSNTVIEVNNNTFTLF